MKITSQVDINVPVTKAIALMADGSKARYWMSDLESFEPATKDGPAHMVFRNGRSKMKFAVLPKQSSEPNELRSTLENSNMTISSVGRFEAIGPATTRYIFEQDFRFKGATAIFAPIMRFAMRKQQDQHIRGFKRFAEATK